MNTNNVMPHTPSSIITLDGTRSPSPSLPPRNDPQRATRVAISSLNGAPLMVQPWLSHLLAGAQTQTRLYSSLSATVPAVTVRERTTNQEQLDEPPHKRRRLERASGTVHPISANPANNWGNGAVSPASASFNPLLTASPARNAPVINDPAPIPENRMTQWDECSRMSAEKAIRFCQKGPEPDSSLEACRKYMLTVLVLHKAGTNGSIPALGAALPSIGKACLEAMRTQRNRKKDVWHNIYKPAFFEAVASDQDFRGTVMKAFWTLSYVCRNQLGIQKQLEQMYPEEWSHAMPAAEALTELQISSMSAEAAIRFCRTGPEPKSSPEACEKYMLAVMALHKAGTTGSNPALGEALPSIGKACLEAMHTQIYLEKKFGTTFANRLSSKPLQATRIFASP